MSLPEFSFRSREIALRRLRRERFDLLIIGGGITGAATARDAASRGLRVALVEMGDFASGTSSRSSKLIHGGLRYLENFELGLVFEALAERRYLLKAVPHLVKPLPFFFPVYSGDPHGLGILGAGLWLYDLLALFRAPGFHRRLSKKKMMKAIPFLRDSDLKGGFRYFDASMRDDVLAVETLRAASGNGALVVNYVRAEEPIRENDRVVGFEVEDVDVDAGEKIQVRAEKVVICAGPWTDELGSKLTPNWKPWLNPSQGVHLVFDLKRIPIPGALVMSHPEDGRIAFVIPRPDLGAGVVIVGTTDSAAPKNPSDAKVRGTDIQYLMALLDRYFPELKLTTADILSTYVGIRPLMGAAASTHGSGGRGEEPTKLQKVSREHFIGSGPGGMVLVAGGKYTTHRKMAREIVDFTLKLWKKEWRSGRAAELPRSLWRSRTGEAIAPEATPPAIRKAREEARRSGLDVPEALFDRFGAAALDVFRIHQELTRAHPDWVAGQDPEGFPFLAAQLVYCMRNEMVLHLEDFYFRRVPLFLARADHGLPWAETLSRVWAVERGLSEQEAAAELARLAQAIEARNGP